MTGLDSFSPLRHSHTSVIDNVVLMTGTETRSQYAGWQEDWSGMR